MLRVCALPLITCWPQGLLCNSLRDASLPIIPRVPSRLSVFLYRAAARIRRRGWQGQQPVGCCVLFPRSAGLVVGLGRDLGSASGLCPCSLVCFFSERACVCLSAPLSQEEDTVYLEILEILSSLVLSWAQAERGVVRTLELPPHAATWRAVQHPLRSGEFIPAGGPVCLRFLRPARGGRTPFGWA